MADEARLTAPLQESTLTLLAFSQDEGAVAAGLVTASLFDEPYKDVAARILQYRKRYGGEPPGSAHIEDLFDDVLTNGKNPQQKVYIRILDGMLQQAKDLNAGYVLKRISTFVRQQNLKVAVVEAAQRYQQGGDDIVDDVENILFTALKTRANPVEGGVFLDDVDTALGFLEHPPEGLPLGIPQFDRVNAGPASGEIMVFLAPKGRGKTWACTHVGKRALMRGESVLHISLEMGEAQIAQRYFQSLFAIAKRNEDYWHTFLDSDQAGRLDRIDFESRIPERYYSDPKIGNFLRREIGRWGSRLGRLVVKAFPSGTLTIGRLNAYLDWLETVQKFIPKLLIVDYPDLMNMDRSKLREQIGQNFIELRGLCGERNLAGFFPSQTNRASTETGTVKESHVAEDFSKLQTADKAIIYSQTQQEKAMNLARLTLDKNRGDRDGFTVLISQSYTTGQFVIGSPVSMSSNYFELLKQTQPPGKMT